MVLEAQAAHPNQAKSECPPVFNVPGPVNPIPQEFPQKQTNKYACTQTKSV